MHLWMEDLLLVDNYNNDNDNDNSNNNLVQNLVDNSRDAFNSHDPKTPSSLLTEDGEWTDVIGYTTIGRFIILNFSVILLIPPD